MLLDYGPAGGTPSWNAQTAADASAVSDAHAPENLPGEVESAIHRLIAKAAQDGSAVSPATIVEQVLAGGPDSKLLRIRLAEAILRAAASQGLGVQVSREA